MSAMLVDSKSVHQLAVGEPGNVAIDIDLHSKNKSFANTPHGVDVKSRQFWVSWACREHGQGRLGIEGSV